MSQQEDLGSRRRRRWTPEQKARIVRRHLQEKVSLADLADETGAAPGQISQWCKQALEGAVDVFTRRSQRAEARLAKELRKKEARIRQLHEVVAELSEEVLRLKKTTGVS